LIILRIPSIRTKKKSVRIRQIRPIRSPIVSQRIAFASLNSFKNPSFLIQLPNSN
jgi:hypothetical protein